jgi:hypothetical protein
MAGGDEPTLFDLPPTPRAPASSRAGRGRSRETYARTVVVDVTLQRPSVLRDAALRAFDDAPAWSSARSPTRQMTGPTPATRSPSTGPRR